MTYIRKPEKETQRFGYSILQNGFINYQTINNTSAPVNNYSETFTNTLDYDIELKFKTLFQAVIFGGAGSTANDFTSSDFAHIEFENLPSISSASSGVVATPTIFNADYTFSLAQNTIPVTMLGNKTVVYSTLEWSMTLKPGQFATCTVPVKLVRFELNGLSNGAVTKRFNVLVGIAKEFSYYKPK